MFFLEQIQTQFILTLSSYDGPSENAAGGNPEEQDTQEIALNNQLSPEDQEKLQQIEKELGKLDAIVQVGGQQLRVYTAGLKGILADNPNEAEEEPKEMAILRGNIERLTTTLEQTQLTAGEIRQGLLGTIEGDVAGIQEGIDILQGETNELTEEMRADMQKLESSYSSQIRDIRQKLIPYMQTQQVEEPFLTLSQRFDASSPDFENMGDMGKYFFLTQSVTSMRELNFDIDIAIRDQKRVGEDGEKVGEIRDSLVEQKIVELKESDNESLSGFLEGIEYVDLERQHFSTLAERFDVNLAEFMIIGENGNVFDGKYEEGGNYIFNSGENTQAGEYVLAYIFDIEQVKTITFRGTEYSRSDEVGSLFKDSEGNAIGVPRDGELITVSSVEPLTEENTESMIQARTSTHREERSRSVIRQAFGNVEASEELNGFDFKSFWEAFKKGDAETLIKQLEHLLNLEFHVDEETGDLQMVDPYFEGDYLPADSEYISSASFEDASMPQQYRANFIESARRGGISPDALLDHMNSECEKFGFPPQRFVVLIGKESSWNNAATAAPISTAKGFSQMLDGTWSEFGVGDRSDPRNQLTASLRYLNHIMTTRGASPEDACALYNTGPYFKINNSPAPANVVNGNPVIVRRIPDSIQSNGITQREYFLGAVSYYNDISFSEASQRSSYARRA